MDDLKTGRLVDLLGGPCKKDGMAESRLMLFHRGFYPNLVRVRLCRQRSNSGGIALRPTQTDSFSLLSKCDEIGGSAKVQALFSGEVLSQQRRAQPRSLTSSM